MENITTPEARAPDVSVVVAVLNAAKTLTATLRSIVTQKDVALELLVVDGGSTDGSWGIIQSFSDDISWCVSERDAGIYDAWNKALEHARGRYVCFLGADDQFAVSAALAKLVAASGGTADLVSCSGLYKVSGTEETYEYGGAWDWRQLQKGMCVDQRGMLHSRALFDSFGGFNSSYKISGDFEFLLRCGPDLKATRVPEALVLVGPNGVSSTELPLRMRERRRAQLERSDRNALLVNLQYLKDLLKVSLSRFRQ
jgi:glycosyltransferase involved in cell wall biosynthesis